MGGICITAAFIHSDKQEFTEGGNHCSHLLLRLRLEDNAADSTTLLHPPPSKTTSRSSTWKCRRASLDCWEIPVCKYSCWVVSDPAGILPTNSQAVEDGLDVAQAPVYQPSWCSHDPDLFNWWGFKGVSQSGPSLDPNVAANFYLAQTHSLGVLDQGAQGIHAVLCCQRLQVPSPSLWS